MFLETKSKFNNGNPKRGQSDVKSRNFFNWSNNNQYRSSYHDMYSKTQVEQKTSVKPEYNGFVPYIQSTSDLLGEGFTKISRKCFSKEVLDDHPYNLSTTGMNKTKIEKSDPTLSANTHKYGVQTMHLNHPCVEGNQPQRSTSHLAYKNPMHQDQPNQRIVKNQSNENFLNQSFQQNFSQNNTSFPNIQVTPRKDQDSGKGFSNYQDMNKTSAARRPQVTVKTLMRTLDNMQDPLTKVGTNGMVTQTQSGYFNSNKKTFDTSYLWKQNEQNKTLMPTAIDNNMIKTEYRQKYNQPKPFQKVYLKMSTHRLARKTLAFDDEDKNYDKKKL